LVNAKIATFGEKAEDIFFIQRHDYTAVKEQGVLQVLEDDIITALDKRPMNKKTAKAG